MLRNVTQTLKLAVALLLAAMVIGTLPGSVVRPLRAEWTPPTVVHLKRGDASVDVTVKSKVDHANIAHANVETFVLREGRAVLVGAEETDGFGNAHVANLPMGEYWITADAKGCARSSTNVVLATATRSIAMELSPEHTIDVVVSDELGAKIANAEIEVRGRDLLPIGARTRDDGAAHVTRLSDAPWMVTSRAAGYEEVTERGVGAGKAASENTTLRVTLRKLGAIVTSVVDGDAKAVANARVEIAGASLWPARVAMTGSDGHVRIAGLGAGSYAMRAVRGGDVSQVELGVLLVRGEEKQVTLKIAPGVMVGVRVVEGDGDDARGVASARVTLAESGISPFPIEGATDRDGRTRLGPIAHGFASIAARADGFVARGAVAVPDPLPKEVSVVLVRAGTIIGRIVDSRGFPVDGATIEIIGSDFQGAPIDDDPRRSIFRDAQFESALAGPRPMIGAGELGVMPGPVPPIPHGISALGFLATTLPQSNTEQGWVSRDDGTFRANPVSPGRVRALVRHPQYTDALSDVVTLASNSEAHVDVVMHAGGILEGRVVDSGGAGMAGARVTIAATRGSMERTTRTASDGSFAFAAVPDSITVMVSRDADSLDVATRVSVDVPEGDTKTITLQVPDARAALDARVTDDRGYPIDAAQITASSIDPASPLRTTAFSDAHGDAHILGAKGLALRVEVHAPGHAPKIINVDANAPTLAIELAKAESATGEVRGSRHGETIEGAEVVLYTQLGARRMLSAKDGSFTFNELAVGDGRVVVHAKGYATFSRDVHIEGSGGLRPFVIPRIELEEEGVVAGIVVDDHGDPVVGARVARDRVPVYLAMGAAPADVAVTNAKGAFRLAGLGEGVVVLEAFAPDVGRAHVEGVHVSAGRASQDLRIVLARENAKPASSDGIKNDPIDRAPESAASGGVAVTLGETTEPPEVVIVDVAPHSEAERAGISPGDTLLEIDGAPVETIEDARAKLSGPISVDIVVKLRKKDAPYVVRVTREQVRR